MQQAFKTMMDQMNPQSNQFNNTSFPPGSPFPFPMPGAPASTPSSPPAASGSSVTVDVAASRVEAATPTMKTEEVPPTSKVEPATSTDVKDEAEKKEEIKKYGNIELIISDTYDDFYPKFI